MDHADWLVSEWDARFAEVMETMAGAKPVMNFNGKAELPKGELLWWRQPFTCAPNAPLWIGALEPDWTAVGKAVLASAGVEAPPADEVRGSWLEIVQQSVSSLAQAIAGLTSQEVTCGAGTETGIEGYAGKIFQVEAELAAPPKVAFWLVVSNLLADVLSPPPETFKAVDNEKRPGQSEYLAQVAGSRTFELLLDVELPVSVSFGRATMKIGEAMNLVSGSLVELDRALADPVELLVNDYIIARGEVVVVEGNYGVRLTEIISHEERLQQGKRNIRTG